MEVLLLEYLPILIFLGVGCVFAVVAVTGSYIVANQRPDPQKNSAYECGFDAFADARHKFDVRFYLVAILFIGPLVVTALAHVFLGERVGPRRWAACAVGLIGGLVIVRPGTDVMGWAAIWPVLAVCFWSVYIIITRRISPRNSTGNLMLWTSLMTLAVMALASPWYWSTPQGWQWAGLIAIALMSASSNGVTIRA